MSDADELAKLGALHQRGVLSDDEFARAKTRVLSGVAQGSSVPVGLYAVNTLRRSASERWLGGVCGGLAQWLGVEAWITRLVFAALVLCAGTGVLLYGLLWLFVPLQVQPDMVRLAPPTQG